MTAGSDPRSRPDSPQNEVRLFAAPGRYAIIAIAAVAIGGAAFNWYYQRQLHRRSLKLWGTQIAQLIVRAPHVEALRLVRSDDADGELAAAPADTITVGGRVWRVVERRQIDSPDDAPGSSHVRRSLVNDRSFDWQAPPDDCRPDWQYALRFRDEAQTQTIVLDLRCRRLALVGSQVGASIRPLVPPLAEFFDEQFPSADHHEPIDAAKEAPGN